MFLQFINILWLGAIYGLVFLFGFKFISAGIQAYKEAKVSNRRFVDTLKEISKTKKIEKLGYETSVDENGNTEISFKMDGHRFVVSLTPQRRLMSCVGYHREYNQQVLHFVYDNSTNTYIEKNISSSIINNEKKDVKKINSFMNFVTSINWDDYVSEDEERDYKLVKGSLYNITDISTYLEKELNDEKSLGGLTVIKNELDYIDIPLKDQFIKLIDASLKLSGKIDNLDAVTKHRFHSIVERDISKTYYAYKKLNAANKTKFQAKFEQNLNIMLSVLNDILESIENDNIFDVEKTLRVIEEKYKK